MNNLKCTEAPKRYGSTLMRLNNSLEQSSSHSSILKDSRIDRVVKGGRAKRPME